MKNVAFTKTIVSFFCLIGLATSANSALVGDCVDLTAGEAVGWSNCTAGDIGVNYIKVLKMVDGCVSPSDTATVNIEMSVTATVSRYDIGVFLDLDGGDARTGTNCVHEVLFTTGTPTDLTSGIGPFLDTDGDTCGDMDAGETWIRRVVQGDVAGGSTTFLDVDVACSDINPVNGYVDLGWAVSWRQNDKDVCNAIADNFPGTKSKCNSERTDTSDSNNPIPIGVPDMGVSISCNPSSVDIGEKTTCTATYTNSSTLGAADYLKFYINYPTDRGSIVNNEVNVSDGTETATDGGAGLITWTMTGGQAAGNIVASESRTITFDYLYTGGPDFDFSIDTFFDNGVDTETNQSLSASAAITTLPITVAYVYPTLSGDLLNIDFGTASETSNVGFNIYAFDKGAKIKLNATPIPGAIDTFEPRDYSVSLTVAEGVDASKLYIAGIDYRGEEEFHGPYQTGKLSGAKTTETPIDWSAIKSEVEKVKTNKASLKAQGQTLVDTYAAPLISNFGQAKKSGGNVTRLKVTQSGIQHVSHADLLAAGIDLTGTKYSDIAVSFRGERVPRYIGNNIAVNPIYKGRPSKGVAKWSASSWIEFEAEAPSGEDALYLDGYNYLLSSVDSDLYLYAAALVPGTEKTLTFEENNLYSNSLPNGDPFYEAFFFSLGEGVPGNYSRTFDLPELPQTGTSTLEIGMVGFTETAHVLNVYLNDTLLAREEASGWIDWPLTYQVSNTLLQAGANILALELEGHGTTLDMVVFDHVAVTYDDGKVEDPQSCAVEVAASVDADEILPPEGTDLLIIANPIFLTDALNDYVTKRQQEGWTIHLADVEEIYAAYDAAMATPVAIKAYIEAAAALGVTHVQLVGAASYDNLDHLGTGAVSLIPSIYVHTYDIVEQTPCDSCYALNADDTPKLAIGRWPVRTAAELETIIAKTLTWESAGQAAAHTALFIADEDDAGSDFGAQLDEVVTLFDTAGWEDLSRVYLQDLIDLDPSTAVTDARTAIFDAFRDGASIVSYSGHSATSRWSFSSLLKQDDIANLENATKPVVALPLACFTTYADSPYTNTMAHQLLAAGATGAVAVYGASTLSDYHDNGVAIKRVINEFLSGKTLGNAVKDAKVGLGSKWRDTNFNGNLLGDVTLKLR